ncbi:hypothetical protein C8J56DRAFT_1044643 [Mycena floridula]|nr:hypothetical protein C8J56DRAFT_1044643 [Mycena floridula]
MSKRRSSGDGYSSDESPPSKRPKHSNGSLKIYLIPAKLDNNTISELTSLIESTPSSSTSEFYLESCLEVQDADIVITAVRMRKRLERHLNWELAKHKAVVTPDWLRDSVKQQKALPSDDYVAIAELEAERHASEDQSSISSPRDSSQPPEPTVGRYTSRYSCQRDSPLVCPNEDLVQQFSVLRRNRELEGLETNALSYERAIGVSGGSSVLHSHPTSVPAYPHKITQSNFTQEVSKLPGIGGKMASKIQEYLDTGNISERNTILASSRFQILSTLSSIYGVGAATARKLYSAGVRSIADLEKHDTSPQQKLSNENLPTLTIKESIRLMHELDEPIPRAEVEEIERIVIEQMASIKKGCFSTITGGYRRGKPASNDVDIVITHRDLKSASEQVAGLCKKLVKRLYDQGFVTHAMQLSSFHPPNEIRTSRWDSLEKALTVFKLPENRFHRRVDIIVAAQDVYWSTIVGWTGSKLFERDLRLWAKNRQVFFHSNTLPFDSSGITRLHDSKLFFPKSEHEVFDFLGLEFIRPEMRNADA